MGDKGVASVAVLIECSVGSELCCVVLLCCVMLCCIVLCCVLCYAVLCVVLSVVLCYAVLYCVVLCVMLCCAVLCCVVCYVMLCCAVCYMLYGLSRVARWWCKGMLVCCAMQLGWEGTHPHPLTARGTRLCWCFLYAHESCGAWLEEERIGSIPVAVHAYLARMCADRCGSAM